MAAASVRNLSAATRSEIEALSEIFDQYRAHYGESSAFSSGRWLTQSLHTGKLQAFVAEQDGRLVGFATTIEIPASLRLAYFWQIRDLFTLPAYRRQGIGRTLLTSIREAAIASGALRLVLQTETDNEAALRLYEKSGYHGVEGYSFLMHPLVPEAR